VADAAKLGGVLVSGGFGQKLMAKEGAALYLELFLQSQEAKLKLATQQVPPSRGPLQ
jgi:hypothetical protein